LHHRKEIYSEKSNDLPRISRITLMLLCMFLTLTVPASATARTTHVFRLLILDSQLGHPYDEVRAAMLKRLDAFGYHAEQNLQIKIFSADNDIAKGVHILKRESKHGYDVIFVGGTVATIAAKRALDDANMPVVFGSPTDPVGIGVIKDFITPPKGHFTGVCYPVPVKARMRFIRKLLPQAHTLGLIYADMPQSHSYNRWIKDLMDNDPEFKDMTVIFRSVALVTGEHGDDAMAKQTIPIIHQLNHQVDAFIKPNDQLGTREALARVMWHEAKKPLIGIVKSDVMAHWGATAVVYPSHESIGRQSAAMIKRLFEGESVHTIIPQWPARYGYAVDLPKAHRFGITVPIGLLQLAGKNIITTP